jgi:hypothetical protein
MTKIQIELLPDATAKAASDAVADATGARPALTDAGISLQILNNQNYSFILRGNLVRTAAQAKPPRNPCVENNFVLLDESTERRKSVRQVAAKPLVRGGKARP